MGLIKSYKDLIVWQKSISLVKEIFFLTKHFPTSEKFGLVSQMRRAAISIPSNIAEGFGRRSLNYSVQFYSIAYGSALELETQLLISKELRLTEPSLFEKGEELLLEICKMLNTMTGKLKPVITSI